MELPPLNPPAVESTNVPRDLAYYQAGLIRKIPRAISVIAIISIVVGSLVVLCNVTGLIWSVTLLALSRSRFMAGPNAFQTTTMKVVGLIEVVVGLALGGILLAGGIGGVQVRSWARKLLLSWAVASLIFHVLTCGISLCFVVLLGTNRPRQVIIPNPGGGQAGVATYNYHAGNIVAISSMAVLSCILPVCILIFWRRPEVVEAFEVARQDPPLAS